MSKQSVKHIQATAKKLNIALTEVVTEKLKPG
jgi:hypothetical protein